MRMEKRKNLEKKLFTIMIAGVLAVTSVTTVFAAEGSDSRNIGCFSIAGSNKVVSTYGKGTTGGSAKPYKNYVVVSIYNKKHKQMSIGNKMAANAKASKTLLGVNPKRVYSCHGVYDGKNNIVGGRFFGIDTPR